MRRAPSGRPGAVQADEIPLTPCMACAGLPPLPGQGVTGSTELSPAPREGTSRAPNPGLTPVLKGARATRHPPHPPSIPPGAQPVHQLTLPFCFCTTSRGFCSNAPKQPLRELLLLGCFGFTAVPYSKQGSELLFRLPCSSQGGWLVVVAIPWELRPGTPVSGLRKGKIRVGSRHEVSLI